MNRPLLFAVTAAAIIVAATAVGTSSPQRQAVPATPARIYGTTAPTPSAAARPSRVGTRDAERVAASWAAAWGQLTACPGSSPRSLARVLELSAGTLRDTLAAQPPRPTGALQRSCRAPRLKRVELHRTQEGWVAIATRRGDGLRPLRLRLQLTAGHVRVTAIDF